MKILVAGATGVIGRRLVPLLVQAGHEVVGTSRSETRAAGLGMNGARGVDMDILDRQRVAEVLLLERPDVVIDQVTDIPRRLDPSRTAQQFEGNTHVRARGTHNLMAAAKQAGVRRVIAQSYAHIYAPRAGWVKAEEDELNLDPDQPVGRLRNVQAVRSLEESVLGTEGIEGVALRYGTWYGPGTAYAADGSIAELVRIRHYPLVGDGRGITSFLHVDDAVAATLLALTGPPGVYNIVDDEPAAMAEWLPYYAALLHAPPARRLPAWLIRAAGREQFAFRSTAQRGASNARAKDVLGFAPRYASWRQGFKEELEAVPLAA